MQLDLRFKPPGSLMRSKKMLTLNQYCKPRFAFYVPEHKLIFDWYLSFSLAWSSNWLTQVNLTNCQLSFESCIFHLCTKTNSFMKENATYIQLGSILFKYTHCLIRLRYGKSRNSILHQETEREWRKVLKETPNSVAWKKHILLA